MLTADLADPVLISTFGRLFQAETEEAVDAAFTELGRIGEHYSAEFRKAEDKARAKMGVARVATQGELDQAMADWGVPEGLDSQAATGDEG